MVDPENSHAMALTKGSAHPGSFHAGLLFHCGTSVESDVFISTVFGMDMTPNERSGRVALDYSVV